MIAKTKSGREVEFVVWGIYEDDIQVDDAFYVDDIEGKEEVSDDDLDYIQDKYASEIYQEWLENQICAAEYACEEDR